MVEGGGFEPPKAEPADLQSAPFDRSGTPPVKIEQTIKFRLISMFCQCVCRTRTPIPTAPAPQRARALICGARRGIRTHDLLILTRHRFHGPPVSRGLGSGLSLHHIDRFVNRPTQVGGVKSLHSPRGEQPPPRVARDCHFHSNEDNSLNKKKVSPF